MSRVGWGYFSYPLSQWNNGCSHINWGPFRRVTNCGHSLRPISPPPQPPKLYVLWKPTPNSSDGASSVSQHRLCIRVWNPSIWQEITHLPCILERLRSCCCCCYPVRCHNLVRSLSYQEMVVWLQPQGRPHCLSSNFPLFPTDCLYIYLRTLWFLFICST